MTHKEVIHFPIQWSTLRPFWFSTYLKNILESTSEVRSDSELISWGCQLIMCKSTNSTKNLSTSNIQIIWKKISLPAPLPLHSLPTADWVCPPQPDCPLAPPTQTCVLGQTVHLLAFCFLGNGNFLSLLFTCLFKCNLGQVEGNWISVSQYNKQTNKLWLSSAKLQLSFAC